MNSAIRICLIIVFAFVIAAKGACQDKSQGHALTFPAGKNSVVRFFYQPQDNNYFHVPLVFRVVDNQDARWNTAPVFDVGRTAYITLSEMLQLVASLSRSSLAWHESTKVENLETYKTIHSYGGMGVTVLSVDGTAKATIEPSRICDTLASLDAVLQTPRALWEFQLFRMQYHCQVPNFDPKAYPDRIP